MSMCLVCVRVHVQLDQSDSTAKGDTTLPAIRFRSILGWNEMAAKDTRYSNIREFTDNSTHAQIKAVRDSTVQGSGKQKRRRNKRLMELLFKKKRK